ncbi:MAG: hypothetical protein Tsb0014_32350 [Pleurocapsa sp.]
MMKRWWQFLAIVGLGWFLSLSVNLLGNSQTLPSVLVEQAQQQYQASNFAASIELLQQANQTYQLQGDRLHQAQILSLIALAQQQLGNWETAQQNIDSSWDLLNSEPENQLKQRVEAQIWNSQGHLALARGKTTVALTAWQNSEQLYKKAGDRMGVKGSLINQAQAMENLGYYRRACDRTLLVFDLDSDCQQLDTKQLTQIIQQVEKQPSFWQISALRSLGNTLMFMGKLPQAEVFIQASQRLCQQLEPKSPQTQAQNLLSLGNLHQALALQEKEWNNQASSDYHVREALNYYQKIATIPLSPNISSTYQLQAQLNQLNLWIDTEQWAKAQSIVTKIDSNLANLTLDRVNIRALINFARSLTILKSEIDDLTYSWQEIAALYRQASQQAHQIGDRRLESYGIGYLGQLQYEQNLPNNFSPQQLIEQALNIAQSINAPEIAYRWQWQLGKIYRQQKEQELAIAAYQGAVATLRSLRSDLVALAREVQFSFREQVEPVYREFADLLLTHQSPSDLISSEVLSQARETIEALQVAELDNYFHDACVAFERRNIEEIDSSAAVIYTIILPDRLEVILSQGDSMLHHHTEHISQTELEETITQLRQYIVQPDRTRSVQELATQVYDWLIEPFAADLVRGKTQTLVFVLDNILQTIPMAALYDGEHYLVEKYAIALTPGLRLINAKEQDFNSSMLGAGVSQSLKVENQQFAALNNVETELNNVKAAFPGKILLNEGFTEDNFVQQLQDNSYSIIHLATHGKFSSNPNNTFLLLWQQLLTINDFNSLLQNRKQAISRPIDLLVLSACETAAGDKKATLGLAGISVRTRAISTLATLWQIGDESTAVLMNDFYQKLNSSQKYTKAQALQQAQIDLIQNRELGWQAPVSWAAYILVGNWQ